MNISDKQVALIKVWDSAINGARKYLELNGFTAIHGQPLMGSVVVACENVKTLFDLDFYGEQAFLTQSNQLLIEPYTAKFGRIYCEITSFRQEPNADNRRLAMFNLLEIEHLGGLDELLDHVSAIVYSMINEVINNCQDELKLFGRDIEDLKKTHIGRISYSEAITILQKNGFSDLEWGTDLEAKHEHALTAILGPVLCHRYPKEIKFWNMRQDPQDDRVVLSADLLLPKSGESAGSAERETNYDSLIEKLESSTMLQTLLDQGVKKSAFDWYLNHHIENDVQQHSGAGLGLNRIIQALLNLDDIRDATPFVVN